MALGMMRACFGVSLLVDIFPELKMCMSGCISDRHERCSFRRCFFVTNGSRLTAWLGRPDFAPCLKALGCIKGASSCSACLRTLGYGWYGHLGTASSFFLFFHFFPAGPLRGFSLRALTQLFSRHWTSFCFCLLRLLVCTSNAPSCKQVVREDVRNVMDSPEWDTALAQGKS